MPGIPQLTVHQISLHVTFYVDANYLLVILGAIIKKEKVFLFKIKKIDKRIVLYQ